MHWLKAAIVALGISLVLAPAMGAAQDGTVKIGVLDDMTGPYSDNTGPGDVLAVKMAVADFGGTVMQAKTPEESKGEWDLAKIVATIPGDEAFRPLHEGGCPLVKR
jgi:hypothetical protein